MSSDEYLDSTYEPIISLHVVEQWILDLAEKYFTDYLYETARQNGFSSTYFPTLADWGVTNDYEKWPEEKLPFLLVMYMGFADRPTRYGDGSYDIHALFGASVIASTPQKRDTRIAASVYAAAFEAMMVSHKSLQHPERIAGFTWIDGRPATLPPESARSLGAEMMFFQLDVKNVVNEGGIPPFDEPSDDPTVPPDPAPVVLPEDPDDPTTAVRGGVHITQREI